MMLVLMTLALCLPLQLAEDGEDPEALVQRIRETQRSLDEALLEAADADRGGFAELLAAARTKHLGVIRDLEALIKQAKYSQSSSGGGSNSESSEPPPPSSSESRQSDGASAPDPSEQGAAPPDADGEQEQEGSAEAEGQADQPLGTESDETSGANQPADGPPPEDSIEPITRQDTDDRWGLLPPKLQERLMNLHVDDVPARYRSWLEAYVRSMHELEQRDSP